MIGELYDAGNAVYFWNGVEMVRVNSGHNRASNFEDYPPRASPKSYYEGFRCTGPTGQTWEVLGGEWVRFA